MNDTKTLTDNGNATVVADANATDNRHIANAKALAVVTAVMKSETALAVTAKEFGVAVFKTVYADKTATLDTVIAENKLAAGFKALGDKGEAGRKAKGRLNVYFSNFRFMAERWEKLSQEQRDSILNGETSVHYLAATIRDEERKAEREAAKAEAAKAVDAEIEANRLTLNEQAAMLVEAYRNASSDERNEAFDMLATLFELVDADTKANEANADIAEAA